MKINFNKSLLGAALLTIGAAAQAGTPGTTNLLFPYVTTATGAYTFVSIAQQGGAGTTTSPLHFTYATKPIGAANSAACEHLNGDAASTPNDLMQFEVSNRVNLPAAFGDTTSLPKYFPGTAAAAGRHGMLIVNGDAAGVYGSGATYQSPTLYGEARVVSTASGLAAGYSTDDLHTGAAADPDFNSAAGPDGGPVNANKVISWFQDPTVSTTWFILPLGTESVMAFGSGVTATYQAEGTVAGIRGHFNNNEQFQSSTATTAVTCLGTVTRGQLLGALNAPFSANGGWGNFVNPVAGTNSLVYKLENTSALGGNVSFVSRVPVK